MSRLVTAVLADVPVGAIVRYQGNWGVVCRGNNSYRRVIDFWDIGREYVKGWAVVEVQV